MNGPPSPIAPAEENRLQKERGLQRMHRFFFFTNIEFAEKKRKKIIAGDFFNVKNGSSFITSKSLSKNLTNSRELAF